MTCLLKISNPSKVATGVHSSGHSWPKGVIITCVHSFMRMNGMECMHSIQEAIKLR